MTWKRSVWMCVALAALAVLGTGLWLAGAFGCWGCPGPFCVVEEHEEVQAAQQKYHLFEDDDPSAKNPSFDPGLVDSRPVAGSSDNTWELNASAATMRLDILDLQGERETPLQKLYPSYAAAAKELRALGYRLLPSLNQLDGKAKQFDDGLYAELDAGLTAGKMKTHAETAGVVRVLMGKLDPQSAAYAWLWGALKVGALLPADGLRDQPAGAQEFIAAFERDPVMSEPIGFYTWSEELKRTFRFLRYLMHGWEERRGVPDQVAGVLAADPELLKQYARILGFYAHLTNPLAQLSLLPLTDRANAGKSLGQLWKEAGLEQGHSPAWRATAHFLPWSGSKETRLFERLFGAAGLPPEADLMLELVKAIRSGRVDLKPGAQSGWYDFQVYALETFLLPDRGAESSKLALTKKYKERMLQAFAALITKRRETHSRSLEVPKCAAEAPSVRLAPRLRVEPNPTFFLRSARAYAFLEDFLTATLPAETLKELRGRTQEGQRARPLAEELAWMRSFFYGLHLISCEDIGMRPQFLKEEAVDAAACMKLAGEWLAQCESDPDLAADTRVCVPIFADYLNGKTRLWATLGVRGAKLEARYCAGPSWRPAKAEALARKWEEVPPWQLDAANYVVLVDEFTEIELKGLRVLNREQLREVCDREKSKEAILKALK